MIKSVPIQLDRKRNLRLGFEAIYEAEEMLDKSIMNGEVDFTRMKEVAVILWAGLCHEDESLSPKSVLRLIDEHSDFVTVSKVLEKSIEMLSAETGGSQEKNA